MLEELCKKRKILMEHMKENNYNANEIIANLYSDISHFIYELLQNAEDSEASFISFELKENSLFITHNGKLFDKKDIDAITTIGFSTKKDDLNKIGKFGAGFKSVFAITNTPRIYSGGLSFEIQEYIIPQEISKIELEKNLTTIELPFNSSKINPEKAFQVISEKLLKLETESLLFLKNIQTIKWSFLEQNGFFQKERKVSNNCEYVNIVTSKNDSREIKNYLKIDKIIQINNKSLTLSIAYLIKDGEIIPIDNSLLSVFFPTKVNIYYKFLLQSPFKTTPNRENIPFEDEDNKIITQELSKLVGESFLILKEENLYDVKFLEKMITNEKYHNHILYMSIYYELIKSFNNYELLPTSIGTFAKATDLILGESDELIKFLEDEIFDYTQKPYFFNCKYGNELTRYLMNVLRVKFFKNDDLLNRITIERLNQKDDDWLVSFYKLLVVQNFSKWYLSIRPIMKLLDGSFSSLYKDSSDENPQVYLLTDKVSKFKTLNKIFVENDSLKDFIEKYKIVKPNKIAELKEFILPKYDNPPKITFEEYLEDFNYIVETYNSSSSSDKVQIVNLCKRKYLIFCTDESYQIAEYVYLESEELKQWFFHSPDTKFTHKSINTEDILDFFKAIGISFVPKFNSYNFQIEGLKSLLDNISFNASIMIWDYYIKQLSSFYVTREETDYSSKVINKLKYVLNEVKWLKSKYSEELFKPSELVFNDLDSRYEYPENIKGYLTIDIKFKPDRIQQIEQELGCYVVEKGEYQEFKKWQESQKKIELPSTDNNIWKPDLKSINSDSIKVNFYNKSYYRKNLSYQAYSNYSTDSFNNSYRNIESRKAIGDWGENFVKKYLEKKYKDNLNIEIECLNDNGNIGIGYDFVILENGVEIEYIEVKSKLSFQPSMIEISGTQWEWARTLNNEGNGDKFKIYIVLGAGKEGANINIISNPIKKWIDGEIKANPVNLEL